MERSSLNLVGTAEVRSTSFFLGRDGPFFWACVVPASWNFSTFWTISFYLFYFSLFYPLHPHFSWRTENYNRGHFEHDNLDFSKVSCHQVLILQWEQWKPSVSLVRNSCHIILQVQIWTPFDFHLFGLIKESLYGTKSSSNDEVTSTMRKWLTAHSKDFFAEGIVFQWEKMSFKEWRFYWKTFFSEWNINCFMVKFILFTKWHTLHIVSLISLTKKYKIKTTGHSFLVVLILMACQPS